MMYTSAKLWKKLIISSRRTLIYRKHFLSYRPLSVAVEDKISGFEVKNVTQVPEMDLTAIKLQHIKTNADYLHISRPDKNNVFCVGFRTIPMDSTGVPHILEHLVLCGSKKFPGRDPFFKMLTRSLATFMNAMTGSDYTVYPFSTQDPKDFQNLLSIYLDAVFNPKLERCDFLQEGWRFEHKQPEDKNSPLEIKGVVYNEMKGVFADSQNLFMQKILNGIFPSHTYGFVSGGDPQVIPQLSWENLKKFYAQYYHPSNSYFFSYGDQPLEHHLTFCNDNYLQHYSKSDLRFEVPEEPCWTLPKKEYIFCEKDPLLPSDMQTTAGVSFMLSDIKDINATFTLHVISELLVGGPNSSFYKSLIEPQYGMSFCSSGFGNYTRNTTFTVGLQGIKDENIEKVLAIIDETFDKVIEDGFPKERVEAILHNIELSVKHQTTNFGLNLALSLTPLRNHYGNPIDALKINDQILAFKTAYSNSPRYIQDKLEHYFKNNQHKYTVIMSPKDNFAKNRDEQELQMISYLESKMSKDEKSTVWEDSQALKIKQNEQDISVLPSLAISDISLEIEKEHFIDLKLHGCPIQVCEQPTNGLSYLNILINTYNLPEDSMHLIPIFTGIITKMGAGNLDFRELDQRAELKTGGLEASAYISADPALQDGYNHGILLSSYCLNKNLESMLDLWKLIFNDANFTDVNRFVNLLHIIHSENSNYLAMKGHKHAMTYSASTISKLSALKEQWSGITYIHSLKKLSESETYGKLLDQLRQLALELFSKNNISIALNTSHDFSNLAVNKLESFLSNIKEAEATHSFSEWSSLSCQYQKAHHLFQFPVNYTAKAFLGVPYNHKDSPSLAVLSKVLFHYLHKEIREKGGAYGGGSLYSPGEAFWFYSYRDPNSLETFSVFDSAVDLVLRGKFGRRDIEEAILGVFQSLDYPIAPGSKGLRNFLDNISEDMFSNYRRRVLSVTEEDIVKITEKYLNNNRHGCCIIGPHNKQTDKDKNWTVYSH